MTWYAHGEEMPSFEAALAAVGLTIGDLEVMWSNALGWMLADQRRNDHAAVERLLKDLKDPTNP
jgi:hypothetical protein